MSCQPVSPAVPARVSVCFTHVLAGAVPPAEQGASYCASGYVYQGKLELLASDGSLLLELPVQSGGWMSADSPFARAGLCPLNPTPGAYDPHAYPDTAFPALDGPTELGTLRTGRLRGFRIPDPPHTGRSSLMVHDSVRVGSEGCISTPPGEAWEAFCNYLAHLQKAGVQSLPLRVVYTCPAPNACRMPGAN